MDACFHREGIKKNWYQTIDGIIVMFGLCEDVAYGRHRWIHGHNYHNHGL